MKVLLVNKYLYPKGGDAIYTLELGRKLESMGNEVYYWGMHHPSNSFYEYSNYFIDFIDYNKKLSIFEIINNSIKIIYSFESKLKVEKFINDIVRPDIVHLNNFAHQISPSIIDVFKKNNIPIVMTMHDYKLVCPVYTLLSNNKLCEKCKNGRFYWCFIKKCNKNSYLKSLISSFEMYIHHKIMHIYDKINLFISPSIFLAEKLKSMGFKKGIIHLPNFIMIEKYSPKYEWEENSIVYFGRLSYEKGLYKLISAVKGLNIILKIIGEGPISNELKSMVKNENINNVKFLGYKKGEDLYNEIKKSMFVILPSEWYENNPLSILESFAFGKPVIASNIGGIPELVKNEINGLLFEYNNLNDLKEKIKYLTDNPGKIIEYGKNARQLVENNYNSQLYYNKIINIYNNLIKRG